MSGSARKRQTSKSSVRRTGTQLRRPVKETRKPFSWSDLKYQGKTEYFDYNLLAMVLLLVCFGLIMLYSTSAYIAESEFGDDMHYFKRQAVISAVCMLVAVGISYLDYHVLERFWKQIYVLAAILMIMVKYSPLGITANGSRRWLGYGSISFQPSEFAKIAIIIALASKIISMREELATMKGIFLLVILGGVQVLLCYECTDNLSTAIIILGITVGMIFIADPKPKKYFLFLLGILIVGIIAFAFLRNYALTTEIDDSTPFRIRRIIVWLNPEPYAKTYAYQTLQALYAIGSGGLLGRGLGNSIQKLGSVPEAQNDFIFSIICEELGIIGGLAVVLFFAYLIYRLFYIAQNAPDLLGSLMVSGIMVHISLQVVLNIAVVLNILPNTGVTLPFVSYGGTSILFLMAEMGLALSVSRQIKIQEKEPLL